MKLVTKLGLIRGAAIADYALAITDENRNLGHAEYVGIVADYFAHGHYSDELFDRIEDSLNAFIAERALETFKFFEGDQGRGLWTQGSARDDIRLTNKALIKMHPRVNSIHSATFGS